MKIQTNTNLIIHLLQVSEAKYNQIIMEAYWTWVKIHSSCDSKLQDLLANPTLFNWFKNEYTIYEREFLIICQMRRSIDLYTIREQYKLSTSQVNSVYPSAIIKYIKPKANYTINHITNIFPN